MDLKEFINKLNENTIKTLFADENLTKEDIKMLTETIDHNKNLILTIITRNYNPKIYLSKNVADIIINSKNPNILTLVNSLIFPLDSSEQDLLNHILNTKTDFESYEITSLLEKITFYNFKPIPTLQSTLEKLIEKYAPNYIIALYPEKQYSFNADSIYKIISTKSIYNILDLKHWWNYDIIKNSLYTEKNKWLSDFRHAGKFTKKYMLERWDVPFNDILKPKYKNLFSNIYKNPFCPESIRLYLRNKLIEMHYDINYIDQELKSIMSKPMNLWWEKLNPFSTKSVEYVYNNYIKGGNI